MARSLRKPIKIDMLCDWKLEPCELANGQIRTLRRAMKSIEYSPEVRTSCSDAVDWPRQVEVDGSGPRDGAVPAASIRMYCYL